MSAEPGEVQAATSASGQQSPFIPAVLIALTVVGSACYQTIQLVTGRNNLTTTIAAQDAQMEQSKKVRAALESLATRTARVAREGNANATVIVEELRKRGLTINPDAPPAEPVGAP